MNISSLIDDKHKFMMLINHPVNEIQIRKNILYSIRHKNLATFNGIKLKGGNYATHRII